MKRFTLITVAIAALFLSGCNLFGGQVTTPPPGATPPGSTAPSDTTEEPASEATIQPRVDGTSVSIDCATDELWTCTSEFGGTIKTVDYLVGNLIVQEFFEEYGTTEAQVSALRVQYGDHLEVAEEITVNGAEGAILEDANTGKTHMFVLQNLDGKDDFGVKCEATVETAQFNKYRQGIEEMCSSLRTS